MTTTASLVDSSSIADSIVDPHVAAFCDPNTPEIFRSVAYPTEVWTPDPMDVDSIHSQAREVFDWLLNAATANVDDKVGRILLMLGQSGSGKTHLMRSLRTRTHSRGDGYFGYLQMTSLSGNYSRYVLQKLIDSLDKPYFHSPSRPDETTGLMRLSSLVTESSQVNAAQVDRLREDELGIGQPAMIALELADRIANDARLSDCDPDLLTALLLLQSSQNAVRKRAIKYLRGERLSEYDQTHLGGLTPVDRDEDAIEVITRLGKLAWATNGDAIVICVDQLEDIWHTTTDQYDPAERFRTAATTLNQIVAQVPNAVVVIACLDDFFESVRGNLTQPILDRIEKEKPVPITLQANRTVSEARQLAETHLAYLYDHVNGLDIPDQPVHPLPQQLFQRSSGQLTRDLLAGFRQFRDRCIAAGKLVVENSSPESPPPPPAPDRLEALWNDLREDESNAPPDDDESLVGLLDSAIDLVDQELAQGHSFHSDRHDCDLKVRVCTQGHPDVVILGRLCNKSPRGGALTSRVRDLLETVDQDDSDPIPALIRSTDYKPKTPGAQITKLLAKLLTSGGRKVIVSDSDWRAMAAMRKFRRQYGNDPQFADWLRQSRPLARLKSLRDLLGLDDLAQPTHPAPARTTGGPDESGDGPAAGGRFEPQVEADSVPRTEDTDAGTHNVDDPALVVAPPLGKLKVGRTRNRAAEDVLIDVNHLKRHTGILGSSGSGKTTAALNLIEQLLCQDIPVLMVDRKGDLAAYAAEGAFQQQLSDATRAARQEDLRWCEVAVYTPGQPEGRPIALPIAPEGMRSMKSTDRQRVAVQAASSLGGMLGYRETGRDASKIAVLVQAIELLGSQSDERITLESLISFVDERDDSLLAAIGMIKPKVFDGLLENLQTLQITKKLLFTPDAEPLSADTLLGLNRGVVQARKKTRLSIVNLKFITDRPSNLFWVSQLLLELARWMSKSPSDELQAVVMFDEADWYLPATSKPPTKEPMENLLKRARSAGLGIMLATQSPGDLDYKCRDNVNSWMIGKISEDNAIRKMRSLLDDCRRDVRSELPRLSAGDFFLVSDGEVTPVRSDRSVIETSQYSEAEILRLAARSRRH